MSCLSQSIHRQSKWFLLLERYTRSGAAHMSDISKVSYIQGFLTCLLSAPSSKTLSKLKLCSSMYFVRSTLFLTHINILSCLLQLLNNKILGASYFEDVGICFPGFFLGEGSLADYNSDLGRLLLLFIQRLHFMKIIIKSNLNVLPNLSEMLKLL